MTGNAELPHLTEEAKAIMGKKSRRRWRDMTEAEIASQTKKQLQTKIANGTYVRPRPHTTWKSGWREIGGKRKYYRSRWEANYARYLEWLKSIGEITDWDHEPDVFWFEGIKRGCVSYLPDFRIINRNGGIEYHEVKGWMDDRSKTKIRRMAKYHSEVTLIVIDSRPYNALKRQVSKFVPGWE